MYAKEKVKRCLTYLRDVSKKARVSQPGGKMVLDMNGIRALSDQCQISSKEELKMYLLSLRGQGFLVLHSESTTIEYRITPEGMLEIEDGSNTKT